MLSVNHELWPTATEPGAEARFRDIGGGRGEGVWWWGYNPLLLLFYFIFLTISCFVFLTRAAETCYNPST